MLQISPKQNQIAQIIKERKTKTIVLTGALGTSKTFGAAAILISLAKQYPHSVIGVGRKNLTEMKRGTLLSFDEAAQAMDFTEYHENRQDMFWKFNNGSRIIFFEVDQSRDREFSKIKSMNLSCAFIDEADAVNKDGFLALYGRTGRANKNNAPDFIMLACNPNESWIKEDYYNKHKTNNLPEDTVLIEFEQTDSFLPKDYYQKFETAPENWKKRYLYNDWSYADDDMSMFKYASLDQSHITVLEDGKRYAGLDVARFGHDRSVACVWQGQQLIDITILKEKEQKIDNIQLANLFKNYCLNNQVGYDNAIVDSVGNGGGVVDYLHSQQFYVKSFLAGASGRGNYNNKRSEITHKMAIGFEKGEIKLFDSCPYLAELKKELTMQAYVVEDKVLKIESKEKIKQRLGLSPDISDAVMMGFSLQADRGRFTLDDIVM
jgi:hypothetical protein